MTEARTLHLLSEHLEEAFRIRLLQNSFLGLAKHRAAGPRCGP
jgi:hypothetical protein